MTCWRRLIKSRSTKRTLSDMDQSKMDAEFEGVVQKYDWLSREFHRLVTAKASLLLIQRKKGPQSSGR